MTAQTLAQKLVARAVGRDHVAVGELVMCGVDLAMFHDSSGPRRLKPMLEELGAPLWDPQRVVLVMDHYVPAQDEDSRHIVQLARDWAHDQRLPHVYDSQGICHVVVPQHGHIRPGMFAVGGDSHSCTGGAFGAYMFGIGATEMLGVVVTGEIWLRVPHTLRMRWHGRLGPGVSAKDMMLRMITDLGMNGGGYQAIEYAGEAVQALGMAERMTLANMTAELGAQVGLVAPDQTTADWLGQAGVTQGLDPAELAHWQTDQGAVCTDHDYNATTLAPMVAAPHSPANGDVVTAYDHEPVQVAYIGACTGAKLEDMRAAAQVLRGQRVARGVQLMVAPASVRDMARARDEGVAEILDEAGAQWLPSACGACAGYGQTISGNAQVIATTARNFKGRMGSAQARVFLASPYTVAASAVRGRISDPREWLA